MSFKILLDIAQFVASAATAAGVIFAAFQFFQNIAAERTAFTIQRLDKLHQYIGPQYISDVVRFIDIDVNLSDEEFIFTYWSNERSPIRKGIKELFLFLSLLDQNRFDFKILGSIKFYSNALESLDRIEPYINRVDQVYISSGEKSSCTEDVSEARALLKSMIDKYEKP